MQNLFKELTELLKKDDRFVSEGKLLKNKVVEAALKPDDKLLKLLLSDKTSKKYFFKDIDGVFVFDKIQFQKFVSNKSFLPDSFTSFSNKIGLTSNDEFISESKDVVLSWPYKDCVLEGGQTKEEEKRNEIFWNETLAPDEIDRLLSPKVFTNFKRYDKSGEHKVNDISLDDNLIIKGNNLLALHSLLPVYRGKVKLICVDPPYNSSGSGNTFSYNNNFNHSSWLSFMKSRLEISKELLLEDGFLAISIDHSELYYLGILVDQIYDKINRIGIVSVVHKPEGRNQEKFFATSNEFLLIYSKNKEIADFNSIIIDEKKLKEFDKKDEKGKYKLNNYIRFGGGDMNLKINKPHFFYPVFVNPNNNEISFENNSNNRIKILPITNKGQERTWKTIKETLIKKISENEVVAEKDETDTFQIYEKYREEKGQLIKTHWIDKRYNAIHYGTNELEKLIGENIFSYPKSIHLIKDIVKLTTNKDDIIIDFFGGSGTTGQAVIDLNKEDGGNRKFILCEQLDYIEDVTKERIKKVIEKNDNGGSFIYCELSKLNQNLADQIIKSKTTKDLKSIWSDMKKSGFISYKIDPKEIDENIKEFEKLSFEDQKKFLIKVLDKNHLYVNYSEIEDKDYKISEEDKKLNREFYNLK